MSWTCCVSPLSGTNGHWLIFLPVCWLIWGRHQQTTCFGLGDLVVRPSAVKQHVCYFTSLFWFPIMLKYLMVDSKSWLSWVFKTKEAESECQQESSIIGGQHVLHSLLMCRPKERLELCAELGQTLYLEHRTFPLPGCLEIAEIALWHLCLIFPGKHLHLHKANEAFT